MLLIAVSRGSTWLLVRSQYDAVFQEDLFVLAAEENDDDGANYEGQSCGDGNWHGFNLDRVTRGQ